MRSLKRKYWGSVALYIAMLPVSSLAAFIVPIFTRPMPSFFDSYTWGGWFGTYDNPPQGDRKWLSEHPELTGWKGYLNRVGWMRRNRLYGLKKRMGVTFTEFTEKRFEGNRDVSDKYKVSGTLRVLATDKRTGEFQAFEYYKVMGYRFWPSRCLRVRIGWKIKGDKFDEVGEFGALVFTINPFDTYGDD